jgi:hypothetical protein
MKTLGEADRQGEANRSISIIFIVNSARTGLCLSISYLPFIYYDESSKPLDVNKRTEGQAVQKVLINTLYKIESSKDEDNWGLPSFFRFSC